MVDGGQRSAARLAPLVLDQAVVDARPRRRPASPETITALA